MDLTLTVNLSPTDRALLTQIVTLLQTISKQEQHIMAVLDDLEAEVATNTTVEGSVATLIANLVAELQAAATDPARLTAILDTLKANDARLAALVVANTPAPPVPVPPPA
jgi:flagellar basal body P-ring protein FlgI